MEQKEASEKAAASVEGVEVAWVVILSNEFREEIHVGLPGLHSTFQREQAA